MNLQPSTINRIIWRCPVPCKVMHAFEVPAAVAKSGKRGKRGMGTGYTSLCGQAEIRHVRKKYREPETLNSCEQCSAIRTTQIELAHATPK